jgi:hypothetical protein
VHSGNGRDGVDLNDALAARDADAANDHAALSDLEI